MKYNGVVETIIKYVNGINNANIGILWIDAERH